MSSVPRGHWKTTTFVAALRVGEIAARTIEALIAAIAEAVTKVSPQDRGRAQLRDWLISLVAFARRAADRLVGVVFVIS